MARGGRSGGGRSGGGRSGGSRSRRSSGRKIGATSHKSHGISHHHHHGTGHHYTGSGNRDTSCCCFDPVEVVFDNPYVGNPNVVSLIWDRKLHGFNENSPKLAKMAAEGYDPEPVKRIVAELNALSRSMNFNDQPPELNACLIMLFTLLGCFPLICYLLWIQNKTLNYLEGESNFRQASQAIIMKYNEKHTQSSCYFLEAGEHYPYVLAIHLKRENPMGGDPNTPQNMVNNPGAMVNNTNMMMNAPNTMSIGPQMMLNQNGMNNQMMMNQGQTNFQNFNT